MVYMTPRRLDADIFHLFPHPRVGYVFLDVCHLVHSHRVYVRRYPARYCQNVR